MVVEAGVCEACGVARWGCCVQVQWCSCRRHGRYSHTLAPYRPGQEQRRGSALHTTGTATGQRPSHETSSNGAAPFTRQEQQWGSALHTTGAATRQQPSHVTRQEQQRGSALHTTGAATRQQPSHDSSSDGAATVTRQDTRGRCPFQQHNSKGPTPARGVLCPLHNGTTWGLVPLHGRTERGPRPRSASSIPEQQGGRIPVGSCGRRVPYLLSVVCDVWE